MRDITPATNFIHTLMQSPPDASAWIAGGNNFPSISGLARFYVTEYEGIANKLSKKRVTGHPLFTALFDYTGYAPFLVSATLASTFFCCASRYLKKSVATCGNSA